MTEGKSESTLDQSYSAVKQYYKQKFHRNTPWQIGSDGTITGNPQQSVEVETIVAGLKRACKGDSVVRSEAISYTDIGNLLLKKGKLTNIWIEQMICLL